MGKATGFSIILHSSVNCRGVLPYPTKRWLRLRFSMYTKLLSKSKNDLQSLPNKFVKHRISTNKENAYNPLTPLPLHTAHIGLEGKTQDGGRTVQSSNAESSNEHEHSKPCSFLSQRERKR